MRHLRLYMLVAAGTLVLFGLGAIAFAHTGIFQERFTFWGQHPGAAAVDMGYVAIVLGLCVCAIGIMARQRHRPYPRRQGRSPAQAD